MARKPSLLASGIGQALLPSRPNHKPITTNEKIEAAANVKAKRKVKAMSPPPDTDEADKPAKKRKIKCLPPPEEMAQSAASKTQAGSASTKRKMAITTKEKIDEARRSEIANKVGKAMVQRRKKEEGMARKAVLTPKAAEKEREKKKQEEKDTVMSGRVEKKVKKPNSHAQSELVLLSMGATPSVVKYEDKKQNGVLYRPTARAKADRQRMVLQNKTCAVVPRHVSKVGQKKPEEKSFQLMNLPKELRGRIWKLAVVHHPVAVWPGQPKGNEQPDLCMAGRAVREEAMPVFYEENLFGIDITPLPSVDLDEQKGMHRENANTKGPCGTVFANHANGAAAVAGPSACTIPKEQRPQVQTEMISTAKAQKSMGEIKRWATALESGGHLRKIQHWLFSCTPDIIVPPSRIPKVDDANSVVAYVRIWQEAFGGPDMSQGAQDPATKTQLMWRASVEIHRESCCVIPQHVQYQRCILQINPAWMNNIVSLMLRQAEENGGVKGEIVVRVAEILRDNAGRLVEHRCDVKG